MADDSNKSVVREIDLGASPGSLARLHFVDYFLVFIGGAAFVQILISLIWEWRIPAIGEIDLVLVCGLCFFCWL